jgi:hypothetical protein
MLFKIQFCGWMVKSNFEVILYINIFLIYLNSFLIIRKILNF